MLFSREIAKPHFIFPLIVDAAFLPAAPADAFCLARAEGEPERADRAEGEPFLLATAAVASVVFGAIECARFASK